MCYQLLECLVDDALIAFLLKMLEFPYPDLQAFAFSSNFAFIQAI
jgi:hypothetical protein